MTTPRPTDRGLLAGIALLSACALADEVLLVRLLAIVQWQHFAWMIISLALLGFGASGTFLSLARPWIEARAHAVIAANAVLFGLSVPACFLLAQQTHFNPLELLWSGGQWLRLMGLYLTLTPPFFFAANAIGLALHCFRERIGRIYAADLLGSGMGAAGTIGLLWLLHPVVVLQILGSGGLVAAALLAFCLRLPGRWQAALPVGLALIWLGPAPAPASLHMLAYKSLPQALQVRGAETVGEWSGPLGLLSVVRNLDIPFRHVPGLSLYSPVEPAAQLAVYTDGEGPTAIHRYDGRKAPLAYLDYQSSALPYHLLRPGAEVAVLGAGGGGGVLQARYHDASRIDAVELNPQLIALVRKHFASFAGDLYRRPEVRIHATEARGFLERTTHSYDLIQLELLDAFAVASAGLYAHTESYLYTVEGLGLYLRRLRPAGILAITRWVQLPPRDELKLFATAVEALEQAGIEAPGNHLLWVRNWQTSTLLIGRGAFTTQAIENARRYCAERGFDLAWAQDLMPDQANRYHRLAHDWYHEGARALLSPERHRYIAHYKFDIRPATDERPYFFQTFRWPLLPEALARRGAGGFALLDLGYLVVVGTLLQALLLGAGLILAPLWALRRRERGMKTAKPARVFGYFFAIGVGFMYLELGFIQKFALLLAQPLLSVAVVLAGFLVCAGMGSALSARIGPHRSANALHTVTAGIAALTALYLVLLPPLFAWAAGLATGLRAALALLLIAPLGVCMGLPFPLGMRGISNTPHWIPWAWGINGCTSVVAAATATLTAMHLGQNAVLSIAVLCYLLAGWWLAPRDTGLPHT